jgi:hypothetical protein
MDILTDTNYDFDIWYKTYDPNFVEMCAKSKVPEKWVSYQPVSSGKYSDSIIKPINAYVQNLYPPLKLIGISGNTVTLRQHNHAEILLLESEGILKALDRPWIRQFYNSNNPEPATDDCFLDAFVLYIPWFIDEDVSVSIAGVDGSPFVVYDKSFMYTKISNDARYVEPAMVKFRFKRVGDHMSSKYVGKIKRNTPLFDMSFAANDIIIERVRKFYEENN